MSKIVDATTIPQMIIDNNGNKSKVSRLLEVNRGTVRKYTKDTTGTHHLVVLRGGRTILMVRTHGAAK